MYSTVRIIAILNLLLCFISVQGQVIYFDSLYDSEVSNLQLEGINTGGVVEKEAGDGYYGISYTLNPSTNISNLFFIHTNVNGEIESKLIFGEDTLQQIVRNMYVSDDTTFIVLTIAINLNHLPMPQAIHRLIKFNLSGNIIWSNFYYSGNQNHYSQGLYKNNNEEYVIVGQIATDSTNEEANIHIVKVDSDGNYKWEKQYGGNDKDLGYSVVETSDSGYLIFGWTYSFGNGQRDWYLVKTDSLGNQEWQKTFGNGQDEVGYNIKSLVTGNYILTGGNECCGILRKIDEDGTQIWVKDFSFMNETGFLFETIEIESGHLISVGLTHTNNDAGWLIKTDSEGNLIWQRKYNKNQYTDLFNSVIQTTDGGFLLAGQAINLETLNQDAWLLKVDSMGCTYPNCTVGIDENDNTKVVVDVWPNPVSEVLNIELQEDKNYDLTLTDLQGKVVYASLLDYPSTSSGQAGDKYAIDVNGFANGIYLLTLQNEEQRTTVKVVVQH